MLWVVYFKLGMYEIKRKSKMMIKRKYVNVKWVKMWYKLMLVKDKLV